MQCMPGDEVWLVGERRSTGEQKYYVSNSPAAAPLKMLAAAIKASGLILTFTSQSGLGWSKCQNHQDH